MIEEKLKIILGRLFGVVPDSINNTMYFEADLGADSIDQMEIIMDVEQGFGIVIEDEEYLQIQTVQLLINLIERKLS